MQTFEEAAAALITERIEAAWETLITQEPVKDLSQEITVLRTKLEDSLPADAKELFENFCEISSQRNGVFHDEIYKMAFKDGFHFAGRIYKKD